MKIKMKDRLYMVTSYFCILVVLTKTTDITNFVEFFVRSHSGHSYWWVKKSWWFAVKKLLIIVLLILTFVLMRKWWCPFFRWSLKTNIKSCFYTVSTFCFSFLATLTKAKYFNHRNNLMINTSTKVCLGKTILCVQTQKKGLWWQRSTIFLSLPL